jgi:hypothetical protein
MRRIWLLLLALSVPMSAFGAVECKDSETLDSCWIKLIDASLSKPGEQELLSEETGVDTAAQNLATNKKNFLPLLGVAALVGDSPEEAADGTVALDLNPLLPFRPKVFSYQLQGIFNTQPAVFEALKAKLPEESRDDKVKILQKDLADLSDYGINASFNLEAANWGRRFRQYREVFNQLAQKLPGHPQGADALVRLGNFLSQNPQLASDFDATFTLGSLSPEHRAQLDAQLAELTAQEAQNFKANQAAFAKAGLDRFADLVNNQRQLYFTGRKHFRDLFVGQDEFSLKGTWEWSNVNLNQALKECTAIDAKCLSRYADYVKTHQDAMEGDTRFAVSLEYTDIDDLKVPLPFDDVEDPVFKGSTRLTGGAGLSRVFLPSGPGEPVRMDFLARYEKITDDDSSRRSRLVASLTLTRKFGEVTVPFGIVYANHGEFLTDIDDQVSAHLGIKLDLNLPEAE